MYALRLVKNCKLMPPIAMDLNGLQISLSRTRQSSIAYRNMGDLLSDSTATQRYDCAGGCGPNGTVAAASLQARMDRVVDITRPALPTPSCGGSHRPRTEP